MSRVMNSKELDELFNFLEVDVHVPKRLQPAPIPRVPTKPEFINVDLSDPEPILTDYDIDGVCPDWTVLQCSLVIIGAFIIRTALTYIGVY